MGGAGLSRRLFGTDGVRGVIGSELTPEFVLRLARAIGAYFGRGSRILVGRDTRSGGELFEGLVAAGLAFEGVDVHLAGTLPTPALQLYVRDHGYDAGVMVTASHNPPEYNGIKVVGGDGVEVPRDVEEDIEALFWEGKFSTVEWRSVAGQPKRVHDAVDYYVNKVVENVSAFIQRGGGERVVVDCGGGATSFTTVEILKRLGARPIPLSCKPDPLFSSRDPEPTPDTLGPAASLVRSSGAVFGVGHDADGDRAIVIDDRGRVVWGDRSGALLAGFVAEVGLAKGPLKVYTGVSSSIVVEDYLRPRGIEVVWTPVGAPIIARAILSQGGIAAFEENGGYMHPPHQYVRDGGMKAALLLAMLRATGESLSSLLDRLPSYYPIKTKIPASREEALCAVEAVKQEFQGERMVTIDGVKVIGEGYWVLVRPSGTEPVVRIMLEARSEEEARALFERVLRAVKEKCGIPSGGRT
ncbi:phospho-sugar mutase [Aeropyrum pernix]|uniref:Phospho-sugar mutase n=1 Tax=Aeropyrum pernix TaxID=56636 RepID=A0A401HBH2_AERPX|nr:phospho-sugar mutase [Aeropyrum pernix]